MEWYWWVVIVLALLFLLGAFAGWGAPSPIGQSVITFPSSPAP